MVILYTTLLQTGAVMAGDAMSLQAGYGLTEHVNKPVLSATSSMVCHNNSKLNFWLPILI